MSNGIINTKHQMIAEDTVGLRVGLPQQTLAARKAQGGHHSVSVGGSVLHDGSARLNDVTSCNSRGRIAICATRLSQFHIARRPPGLSDRRRARGFPLPLALGSVATLSLRIMGRSRQFGFPHNRIRQDRDVPESHSFNASQRPWFQHPEHSERELTRAQNPFVQGARSV